MLVTSNSLIQVINETQLTSGQSDVEEKVLVFVCGQSIPSVASVQAQAEAGIGGSHFAILMSSVHACIWPYKHKVCN